MASYINQHSFTLAAAAAMLALAVLLLRDGPKPTDLVALAALLSGLGIAYYLLNPGASTLASDQEVLAQLETGEPVLLEFQSPY